MGFKLDNLLKSLPKIEIPKPDLSGIEKVAQNVAKAVEGAVHDVEKHVDDFAKDVGDEVVKITAPIREHVQLPSLDLGKAIAGIGELGAQAAKGVEELLPQLKIPDIKVPPFLVELFGTTRPEMDKFVKSTEDLRSTLNTLRDTPPSDPKYAQAAEHLKARYGYTPDQAPKPGTLWVSPRLTLPSMPNGDVTASQFPVGPATTQPPDPLDRVFLNGPPSIVMADGTTVTPKTKEEYKQLVADTRAKLGITNPDGSPKGGDPIGVHLTLEGGGGLGKRYAPAFQEMYAMGLVPTSVSGTSVGAIAAGYIAAGADPKTVGDLATDPALAKYFDFQLGGSGLVKGEYMYNHVDQQLRKITGILDRPVTFADLKIPLHLPAAIMSDSNPPPGKEDLTKPENRLFTFGPETTPNTPVVYAMLASGAFPGVLPTVDLVDPTSGRKLVLTDSGVLDGIPMDMGDSKLPELGLTLQEPHSNHPLTEDHQRVPKPLPQGDIDTSNPVAYGLNSLKMLHDSATETKDFHDRTEPKPGEFMLAIPIFDLEDERKSDKSLVFPYNDQFDPRLDAQGRQVARDFFSKVFNDIGDPTKSATNLTTKIPENLSFTRAIDYDGKKYTASYAGGDNIRFTGADGKSIDVNVGKMGVEAMYLDELAFHSLDGELKTRLDDELNPLDKFERSLPFDIPFI